MSPTENIKKNKRKYLTLLITLIMLATFFNLPFFNTTQTVSAAGENWANSDFSKRMKVTIPAAKINGSLSEFPVAVILDEDTTLFDDVQSDGDDIAFYNFSDNTTLYNFEREFFNKDATYVNATFHVNISAVSSTVDTSFWMYYGNSTMSTLENQNATWDDNYEIVWHFADASGGLQDSTGNNNDATEEVGSSPAYNVSGDVGRCVSFDGSTDGFNFGAGLIEENEDATVEFLLKWDDYDETMGMCYPVADSYMWMRYHHTYTNVIFTTYGDAAYNNTIIVESPTDTSNFNHYVGTYAHAAEDKYTYYEGEYVAYSSADCDTYSATPNSIGYNGESNNVFFAGDMDEFRLSSTPRSEDWINATAQSMQDSLLTYGSEEEGGSTVASCSLVLNGNLFTWQGETTNYTWSNSSGPVYETAEWNFTVNDTTSFEYLRVNVSDLDNPNVTASNLTLYMSVDNATFHSFGAWTDGSINTITVNATTWDMAGDPFPIATNMSLYGRIRCYIPANIGNETYAVSTSTWSWDAGKYD